MPLKMYKDEKISSSKIKYVIGIAAGKGGVGKSTVAVNLAYALQNMGYAVGIMDTDIYGPSIRKMLPEDRFPEQSGQTIIPAMCRGIRMISMAYFRKENEAAVVRAPIANGVVTQFIKNVAWGELDFLLIDFPPGTGDIQLTLSQQAGLSGVVMVTTPQQVAVIDVRKAMHMFEQVKIPIVGIVENMSYYQHQESGEQLYLFGKGGGKNLALEAGVPFLGSIPIDPQLCKSGDEGQSLLAEKGDASTTVKIFQELAKQTAEHVAFLRNNTKDYMHNFDLQWKEMSS